MRLDMATLVALGEIAPRLRADAMYAERFNLQPMDIDLMKAVVLGARAPVDASPQAAFGHYLRFLFLPKAFYAFTLLSAGRFCLVAENKSLPGREVPSEGDANGRPMTVAWFEKVDDGADGIIVQPCDAPAVGELALQNASGAEVSRAAGFYPPLDPNATLRAVELAHEAQSLSHDIIRFSSKRVADPDHPWWFVLSDPTDIEEYFFASKQYVDHTKMVLARMLQLRGGETDAWRNEQWTALTKNTLLNLVAPGLGAGVGIAGAGRGRGVGAAGRARGRGGRAVRVVARAGGICTVGEGSEKSQYNLCKTAN